MILLTRRRLEAIQEALNARRAGEIDVDQFVIRGDYEAALRWTQEQIAKRRPSRE